MLIPRTFHWVWLGDATLPDESRAWIQGWLDLHPGWSHRIWSDRNRPPLVNEESFLACEIPAQRADILSYELVLRYGGIYIDTDFECLRNVECLLADVTSFVGEQEPGNPAHGIFGAAPDHPWLADVVKRLPASLAACDDPGQATGPGLVTRVTSDHPEVTRFSPSIFYPYGAHEPSRGGGPFPDAFAVHRWHGSWAPPEYRFSEDFPRETERELCALIPAGARIVTIAEGIDLDLAPRTATPLDGPEGIWGHPEDSADALSRLMELMRNGYEWLVVLDLADWWSRYYAEFFERLEERTVAVHRVRQCTAYALRSPEKLVDVDSHLP